MILGAKGIGYIGGDIIATSLDGGTFLQRCYP